MRKKLQEREFYVWGISALTILIVWGAVIGLLVDGYKNNKNAFLEASYKRFEGEVKSALTTYEAFSNYIFDGIEKDEEILSILHKAKDATVDEKEILRQDLYKKLDKQYKNMKKYEFRQLHFHLPSTESFLRVHMPEEYGDLLLDVRESVKRANEEKRYISGFEEGRIFNGFRYVYPLTYENNHVGTVEISISSASILEVLSKIYEKEDFYFIIDKETVEKNVFQGHMENYNSSLICEHYYVDNEVEEITATYKRNIPSPEDAFFAGLNKEYKTSLKEKKSFSTVYKFKKNDYIVNFLPVKNIKEIPAAYLISISTSNQYNQMAMVVFKQIVSVSFLAFGVIIFGLLLAVYQNKLKSASEIDFLTKIYNRNKFYELAAREMKRAKREQYEMSVMLMDIDHFKKVNDTYGHEWGDEVLKALASLVLKNIRGTDIFARWGGEEFVFLLPHTNKKEAAKVGENLRSLIDHQEEGKLKDITVSIGVSTMSFEEEDIDKQIKYADDAMYQAKKNGRNQVSLYKND